jgi:uncharacterized membrane protein YbhN (UPF0104 family)
LRVNGVLLRHVSPRQLVVAGAAVLCLAVLAAIFLPDALREALVKLEYADRGWLSLAVLCFLASALAAAGMWQVALTAAGRTGSYGDACARYSVGSLVNSFTPARLGGLVRIALFAQTVPEPGRAWATGGGLAAVAAARAVALGAVLCAAVALGAVPHWVAGALLAVGAAGAAAAVLARRHADTRARLDRLLSAFRELGSNPRRAACLLAWALAAAALRVTALAATAAALGVPSAFVVALILLPALDLAGLVSLTPGNVGISSGMTAVALASHGVGLPLGLSAGIAVHAAETAVGIAFGLVGAFALAPLAAPVRRRVALYAGAAASAVACVAFGVAVFPGLA